MLAELDFEIDFDIALDDDTEKRYCHILCCHPNITLCGAYKQVKCGTTLRDENGEIRELCDVCNKFACPDCLTRAYLPCPWCQ